MLKKHFVLFLKISFYIGGRRLRNDNTGSGSEENILDLTGSGSATLVYNIYHAQYSSIRSILYWILSSGRTYLSFFKAVNKSFSLFLTVHVYRDQCGEDYARKVVNTL